MIYLFEAEHITRPTAVKLVKELEDKGIAVEYAEVGRVFENSMVMIATVDEAGAKKIRDRIWELNYGLCCDLVTITEDQLEAYF